MEPELKEKLAGRRVVASISGGKDSAALSLWLKEQEIEHDRVFIDTGWEADQTYEYLRGVLPATIGPIQWIRADLQMVELVTKKAMFPSRQRRYCTTELKVKPMQRHLDALMDAGTDVVNAVGIRATESVARAKLAEWEWQEGFDCEAWRPLIAWSEQDVIDIHTRHGLRPNPLYLAGAARVGCFPCIYARKSEIKLIAAIAPERIEQLSELEAAVTKGQRARFDAELPAKQAAYEAAVAAYPGALRDYERRHAEWLGKPYDDNEDENPEPMRPAEPTPPEFTPSAWFQSPVGRTGTMPIGEVVKWSHTVRGGRQFELFAADPGDAGCMRWGLCDTGSNTSAPTTLVAGAPVLPPVGDCDKPPLPGGWPCSLHRGHKGDCAEVPFA